MREPTAIGIDNGVSGAIAVITSSEVIAIELTPTVYVKGKTIPDEVMMRQMLVWAQAELGDADRYLPPQAFIEGVYLNPTTSRVAIGSMYSCQGVWRGICCGLEMPYTIVPPKEWQKGMLSGIPGKDTKARSILACKQLFPRTSLLRTVKCKVDHDGKADALMIAEYGRRKLMGQNHD